MSNYRRNFVTGGCYFFTVNLLERQRTLLRDHIDLLRDSVRRVRRLYPLICYYRPVKRVLMRPKQPVSLRWNRRLIEPIRSKALNICDTLQLTTEQLADFQR